MRLTTQGGHKRNESHKREEDEASGRCTTSAPFMVRETRQHIAYLLGSLRGLGVIFVVTKRQGIADQTNQQ